MLLLNCRIILRLCPSPTFMPFRGRAGFMIFLPNAIPAGAACGFLREARPELLGEFARLGIPLTLITKENTAQIYRATNLMAQYPNICGIAFEPFDNKQCEHLMARMRNAATARRFWDAVESKLFPATPQATETTEIPLPPHDRVIYAEVNDHYTDIFCTNGKRYVSLQSLSAVVCDYEKQTPFGTTPPLIRIHNKYAVNPAHVLEVRTSASKRDHIITLSTGKELPVSRSYKHNLAHLSVKAKHLQGGGVEHPVEKTNKFLWYSVSSFGQVTN